MSEVNKSHGISSTRKKKVTFKLGNKTKGFYGI